MHTPADNDKQMVIAEVRRFVDREVIPVAHDLEKNDIYPVELIEKLKALGITLPAPGAPIANYVNAVQTGNLLFLAGKGPTGPDGSYLAGPLYGREGIIYSEIDLEAAIREKHSRDVAGHYARPDVFRLVVNVEPKPALSFLRKLTAHGSAEPPTAAHFVAS